MITTRRNFIKTILALLTVPISGFSKPIKHTGFKIYIEPGFAWINNRRIPIVGHQAPYHRYDEIYQEINSKMV